MCSVMADVNPARPSRRDRARATRLRMIHAAQRVFIARGYAGARMIDIATEAGVAVQTVYFTFHTKAELLQACYELAVLGEDDPRPPPAQPWHTAMLDARDGRAAIRRFAEGNSAIAATGTRSPAPTPRSNKWKPIMRPPKPKRMRPNSISRKAASN